LCGNDNLDPGEQCDDGNTLDGDCCAHDCTFEAAGSPCDDGIACTSQDACDGAGLCRGGGAVSVAAVGQYAILRWSGTDPIGTTAWTIGNQAHVRGDVCADVDRMRPRSRVFGDLVALAPSGTAAQFALRTNVVGAVVTGGGSIRGVNNVRIGLPPPDTDGVAPQLDACATVRGVVTDRAAQLAALPPSANLDLPAMSVPIRHSTSIPATGTLPLDQEVVIRINGDLKLASNATITLVGASRTTRVIVQIHGKLKLGTRAKLNLTGLDAQQVIYLVDGAVSAGGYSEIDGTILSIGPSKVSMSRHSKTKGSVLCRTGIKVGSYVDVDPRGASWIGWCD
jgi:cysteine-rich repeat protein